MPYRKSMEIDPHSGEMYGSYTRILRRYYGHVTEKFFLVNSILMIVFAPMYPHLVPPFSGGAAVAAGIALLLFAGVTNPKKLFVTIANFFIAGAGFVVFEAAAIRNYDDFGVWFNPLFLVRQSIAFLFLISLYFVVMTFKTLHRR